VLHLVPGTERVYYCPDFLSTAEHRHLVAYLRSLPIREPDDHDPVHEFAFAHPVYDGVVVRHRVEAAAGTPIWFGGAAVAGAPMPDELVSVRDRAQEVLLASDDADLRALVEAPFTSVYVDHYEHDGRFVPHADRDCYGPVVLGISAGPGLATLGFVHRDGALPSRSFQVEPGSLYAFCGDFRWEPWLHQVSDVTDTRFGISYRQPATERRRHSRSVV